MKPDRKRRIILIDTRFQLRLAGGFMLIQLGLTAVFTFALYVFMDSEIQAGLASAHAAYRTLDRMLFPLVMVLAGFNLALSTALVTSFVVLLSHRIAGPLYRFRKVMEELAERSISDHTSLRPDDQLGALSEPTRQALSTLEADFSALRESLQEARSAHESGNALATREALDHMAARLEPWLKTGT
jgi:methyl-accepting chemotaxis protein